MAAKVPAKTKDVDRLLKALLVISRSTEQIIESRAVESAIGKSLSSSKVQILRLLSTRGAPPFIIATVPAKGSSSTSPRPKR